MTTQQRLQNRRRKKFREVDKRKKRLLFSMLPLFFIIIIEGALFADILCCQKIYIGDHRVTAAAAVAHLFLCINNFLFVVCAVWEKRVVLY